MKMKLIIPILLVALMVSGCVQEIAPDNGNGDTGTGDTGTSGTGNGGGTTTPEPSVTYMGDSCTEDYNCYLYECEDGSAVFCADATYIVASDICLNDAGNRAFITDKNDPRCACVNNICAAP